MKQNKHLFENWKAKLLCFLIACLSYFVIANISQAERTVYLPVDISFPEGYSVVSNIKDSVELIISGSEEKIYMVNVDNISLSADFSDVSSEGVASRPIKINLGNDDGLINYSPVTFYTDPSVLKIFFVKN